MSQIGTKPADFTLAKYHYIDDPVEPENNVNDGNDLVFNSTYRQNLQNSGKVFVLFFINIYNTTVGCSWLKILKGISSDSEIRPIAVCFRYNPTSGVEDFISLTSNSQVYNAIIDDNSMGDDDFSEIPILKDSNGTISELWLNNILTDTDDYGGTGPCFSDSIGSDYQMWAYILGTDEKISDKWHFCRANDPLAVSLCLPPGTSFPLGDITNWSNAIAARCLNLRNPLTPLFRHASPPLYDPPYALPDSPPLPLSTYPGNPIRIPFSRPLDISLAQTPGNWELMSGEAVSNGAGIADEVNYVGRNLIENTVGLTFTYIDSDTNQAAADLDDSNGWAMTIEYPNLQDAAGGTPDSGNDEVSWLVSTSDPRIESPDSDITVGSSPIQVDITFSEVLPEIADNPIEISDNNTSPNDNTPENITWTHTANTNTATLGFTPSDTARDGEYQLTLPADTITDGAGQTNEFEQSWNVTFDCSPPVPVLSITDPVVADGETLTASDAIVVMEFNENVTLNPDSDYEITASHANLVFIVDDPPTTGRYRYTITPNTPPPVEITIQVPAGAAHDIPLGRPTPASTDFSLTTAVSVTRQAAVLVVDVSGSMGWDIPFDSNGDGNTVQTGKWTVMRPRIKTFLSTVQAGITTGSVHGTEDHLALITYNSQTGTVQFAGADWVDALEVGIDSPPSDSMEVALDGINPGGSTAMGSAIKMAYDLLDNRPGAPGGEGSIILFADGQSNTGLDINIQSNQFIIGDPPNTLTVNEDSAKYPIHAIGIITQSADSSSWISTLQNIAEISGGLFHHVIHESLFTYTEDALANIYAAIYSGNSPVIIRSLPGSIPAGKFETTIPFTLDDKARGMQVAVSWPGNPKADFTLSKNQMAITRYPLELTSPYHRIRALRFPHAQRTSWPWLHNTIKWWAGSFSSNRSSTLKHIDRPIIPYSNEIKPGGRWEVVIRRKGMDSQHQQPFYLSVIAEEEDIVPEMVLPQLPYLTEKTFNIDVLMKGSELKIRDAWLTLTYCDVCMANLVADKATQLPSFPPITFYPGAAKGPELITEFAKKVQLGESLTARYKVFHSYNDVKKLLSLRVEQSYRPAKIVTELNKTVCHWQIPGFPFPGNYRLDIAIRGQSVSTGEVERVISRTILVLPSIDLIKSIKSYKLDSRTRWFEAELLPQDSIGNLLGPGYSDKIHAFAFVKGSLSITDRLDGSYYVKGRALPFQPGTMPKLRIRFSGGIR